MLHELMYQVVRPEEECDAGEDRKRDHRAFSAVMIDLRDQIARRDVERDAACDWQRVCDCVSGVAAD